MAQNYEDDQAISTVVANVAHHIDAKRWAELRALYAESVETDYRSLFGGSAQTQPGDALIEGWRRVLAKVKTQHLLGPIQVSVNARSAVARCHVRALHQLTGAPSGEQWEVLGHYVFELSSGDGWKITKMKLETLLQTGNSKLLAEAAAISG
jgi:hypothetical protein